MKTKITNSQKLITAVLFVISAFNLNSSKASDYFWVGGTGNWSDYANHWATASGGVIFHTTIPSPLDDVYFDVNSFLTTGDTVLTDTTIINCKNMDWSGVTNNPILTSINSWGTIAIYGSLTLSPNMKLVGYIGALFKSGNTGNTITSAGIKIDQLTFDNATGSWGLADSLSARLVIAQNGTFSSNNHSITCFEFQAGKNYPASNHATVLLGTSNIKCDNKWQAADTNYLTLDAANATFLVVGDTSSFGGGGGSAFITGDNYVYGDITSYNAIDAGDFNIYHNINMIPISYTSYGYITGSHNTYNDVYFSGNEPGSLGGAWNLVHNAYFNNSGATGSYNTFNKVIFNSDAYAGSRSIYDTLIFYNPGKTITFNDTTTVNGELVLASGTCAGLTVIQSNQVGTQAVIKKPTGNITIDFAQLQDINAIGGATFTANNSINMGNVSGWIINSPAPQNLYWIGGTGNWNDITHWSTSSGGSGGSCIPTQFDSVFFDSNSFSSANDTVYLIALAYCKNMDWSGVTNNPILTSINSWGTIAIYGSLTLSPNMKLVGYIGALFKSGNTGNTITSAGIKIDQLTFDNATGSWGLADSLSARLVIAQNGTFSSNNHSITCFEFQAGKNYPASNHATVLLGTSNIKCDNKWQAADTNYLTLDAANATFLVVGDTSSFGGGGGSAFITGDNYVYGDITSYNAIDAGDFNIYHNINMIPISYTSYGYITGSHNTYNDVYFSGNEPGSLGGAWNLVHNAYFNNSGATGSYNTFNKVIFNSDAYAGSRSIYDTLIFYNPGKTITFNDTTTVNGELVLASGTCAGLTVIQSNQVGTQAVIKKPTGNITIDFAQLQDINAIGGATFTANNSINMGNVSGWIINSPAPQNLYWIGGTGNWNDITHWSTSSGGSGGSCIPTQFDSVFFDSNSFSSANDTVYLIALAYCKNMDWSGVTNNPILTSINSWGTIAIYGSLTLSPNMKLVGYIGALFKSGNTGNTITSAGIKIDQLTFDNATGSWGLADSLSARLVIAQNGTFSSNNHSITCFEFQAGKNYPASNHATVLLGTSNIKCDNKWQAADTNYLTLDAANATFLVVGDTSSFGGGGGSAFITGDNYVYGDITSYNAIDAGDFNIYHNINMIPISYTSYGYITGSHNTYNDVYFSGNEPGSLGGAWNLVHNAYFNNSGATGSYNTFNKVVFNSDAYAGSRSIYDTLIFYNPGKTITFNDTTTVNSELVLASGTGGFPTPVHSGGAGTKAFISIPIGDTLCTDYLYLQDIEAINGTFYAGDNSVDLGNNSGWQWSSCTPDTSNVWPGDANYDLIADNLDVIYIGLAYGYTGTTRAGATTNWVAQPAVDWLQQFANGTNIKHADCDGNGTVNASDTLAVSLNYGLVHPFKNPTLPQPNNFGTDLYFDMPAGALTPGTIVSIPIKFGTSIFPASNIYGIGFTVNYDAALIQAGSMQIDFSNSWLGTSGNTIHLTKDFPLNGTIDMGYVKTDHLNSNGNGTIATLTFTIANNASGYLNLSFSDILVLDRNEFPVPVNAQTAVIYTSIDEHSSIESMINVYPNPASASISITDANHIMQNIKLVDMTGRIIVAEQSFDNVLQLDISKVTKGMYMLSIETKNGILNKKIQIAH